MSFSLQKRQRPIVLHVDDDVSSLMMAEGTLEAAGFDVLHAENGREAVEQFRKSAPDLIIMDALMPEMDGFESISIIRKTPGGEHVPILMITGLEDLDSITRAYDEGATDFLTKPINFHILPHRVQYMMRSKATADDLRESQVRLDNAQRIARIGHWEFEAGKGEFTLSSIAMALLDLNDEEFDGSLDVLLQHIDVSDRYDVHAALENSVGNRQPFNIEFRNTARKNDAILTLRLEAEPYANETGEIVSLHGTIQDISERTKAQKQIHDLAYYDIVTGLPNRAFLTERLQYILAVASRNETKFALLFLDLDHFKQVNDTLGHDAGDSLLEKASKRLNAAIRDADALTRNEETAVTNEHTVARIGGDEFVVLLSNINREEDAAVVACRIGELVAQPFSLGENDVNVTTTIGISVYPNDGSDAETLMKHADVAMYHAKEKGRNGYQFYSRDIHDQALERFALEKDLRAAIENGDLHLLYQPKISMETGEVSGVEALVRWDHAQMGTVSPGDFIPLAEETGLILPLGKWVLMEACRQMKVWASSEVGELSMAINCSTLQFVSGDLQTQVQEAIENNGLAPELLELELTESLLLSDIEVGIEILNRLKTLGVTVSVDDFGTGFSSLSYLKRLPVDKLKIDQSFVKDLVTDKGDEAIVSAIITLSHKLGLTVVAEGVETAEQSKMLADFNCNEIQGYLISYPLSADELAEWLLQREPPMKKAS